MSSTYASSVTDAERDASKASAAHITTWEHRPPLALLGWLLRFQRQAEPKRRSLPWRTLDAHLSLMLLNDGATNIQSQAESDPSATLDLDPLGAVEAFPDLLLFLWRQPWSCIAHPQLRLLVSHLEADLDGAIRWRVF